MKLGMLYSSSKNVPGKHSYETVSPKAITELGSYNNCNFVSSGGIGALIQATPKIF